MPRFSDVSGVAVVANAELAMANRRPRQARRRPCGYADRRGEGSSRPSAKRLGSDSEAVAQGAVAPRRCDASQERAGERFTMTVDHRHLGQVDGHGVEGVDGACAAGGTWTAYSQPARISVSAARLTDATIASGGVAH